MPVVFGEAIPKASQPKTPILPNIEKRTRPRFSMLVHPHQWEWDSEVKSWMPRISKYKHDPGVQGVSYDSINKVIDTSEADNFYRRKGYVVMDNGDTRLLSCSVLNDGEFMVRFRSGKGYAYAWVWEGFEKVGNQVIWEDDAGLKREIQTFLMEAEIVPEMNPRLKQMEINRLRARVRRLSENATENSSPSLRLRLKAAENLLADWEADLEGKTTKTTKKTTKGTSK